MALSRSLLAGALTLALIGATGAAAQPAPPDTKAPDARTSAPGGPAAKAPDKTPARDRARNINFLFEALKAAPDEASAKLVEERIWALWLVSGSSTTDLLMTRAKAAVDANDTDLALQLLDAIVEISPDYLEAWNRRATIHFIRKDYGRSLADIRQILAREPRHFGAWSGLGLILQDIGEEKRALEAFRRALDLHPHMQRVPDLVKTLSEKVEGRGI